MALPDLSRIQRIPGRLVQDPTDFTAPAAYPYGGTSLGSAKGVHARWTVVMTPVRAAAFGTVKNMLYAGESVIMVAALRTHDEDAVSAIFTRVATGGVTGRGVVEHHHSSYRAGQLQASRAIKICHVPDDPLSQPALYLRLAIPMLEEQARIMRSMRDETVYPVVFQAIPPSSGPTVQMGLIEDLTV